MSNTDVTHSGAEFRRWVKIGTGRPALALQSKPTPDEFHAALLHACTHNDCYDRQLEGSRAAYLWKLVHLTDDPGRYRAHLTERLKFNGSFDETEEDPVQIFELLCRFAENDQAARSAVRTYFATELFDLVGYRCAEAIVGLDGIDALVLACDRFAKEYDEELWAFQCLVKALRQRDGPDEADAALSIHCLSRPALAEMVKAAQADADREYPAEPYSGENYSELRAQIDRSRGFPIEWINAADDSEIRSAAADLMAESDPDRIRRYLRIFRDRPFPGPTDHLLALRQSPSRPVARMAISALAAIKAPEVRRLAFDLIEHGPRKLDGLRFLERNYENGDLPFLLDLAQSSVGNDDDFHDLCLKLPKIWEFNAVPTDSIRENLILLYEYGPCVMCRERIVETMVQSGCAPDWLAREVPYDANPDIASLFQPPIVSE